MESSKSQDLPTRPDFDLFPVLPGDRQNRPKRLPHFGNRRVALS